MHLLAALVSRIEVQRTKLVFQSRQRAARSSVVRAKVRTISRNARRVRGSPSYVLSRCINVGTSASGTAFWPRCRPGDLSSPLKSADGSRCARPVANSVAKYLPAELPQPTSGLDDTSPLNATERLQQLWRIDISDGPRADQRENIRLKPRLEPRPILGGEPVALVIKPFASHRLEGVPGGELSRAFGCFPCCTRIVSPV